eukprot:63358_1
MANTLALKRAYKCMHMPHVSKYHMSNEVLMRSISQDSKKPVTHLTFKTLFEHTKFAHNDKNIASTTLNPQHFLIQSAEFARTEKPSRIAKLIMCLKDLPYGVAETESIDGVINDYITTYQEMKATSPIKNIEEVAKYADLCKYFLLKHLLVIPKISYGLLQKSTQPNTTFSVETCPYLNDFIDEFAEQRIGLRVLAGHMIALYDQIQEPQDDEPVHVYKASGLFEENCNIIKYVENAIIDAKADCFTNWNDDNDEEVVMPNVEIHDVRKYDNDTNYFTYIPEHLHHMVFELVKNSMRAVMEFEANDNLRKIHKTNTIQIVIVNNRSDGSVSIKMSDNGGGINRNDLNKIWLYSYTTAYDLNKLTISEKKAKQSELLGQVIESAEKEWQYKASEVRHIKDYTHHKDHRNINIDRSVLGAVKYTPMFGLGYGLPICRVYAKYFGGSCQIQSIDGYGTDAYLYLNNLKRSNVRVI